MTDSMVERVARAIEPYYPLSCTEDWLKDVRRGWCETVARAAIAAMREPTEAMLWAGSESIDTCTKLDPCGKAAKHCWSDMIDAALTEGKE